MRLDDNQRQSFLKDEYLLLQNQYEDFDRRSLTIKGWVASGAVAALAISFSTAHRLVSLIPLFVIAIAVVFWYLEAKWKLFQYALAGRIRLIEAYFRGDSDITDESTVPFQIYQSWYRSYIHDDPIYPYAKVIKPRPQINRLIHAAMQPFVGALYLVIIILSILSFILLLAFPVGKLPLSKSGGEARLIANTASRICGTIKSSPP
jgi:hypothetical protein